MTYEVPENIADKENDGVLSEVVTIDVTLSEDGFDTASEKNSLGTRLKEIAVVATRQALLREWEWGAVAPSISLSYQQSSPSPFFTGSKWVGNKDRQSDVDKGGGIKLPWGLETSSRKANSFGFEIRIGLRHQDDILQETMLRARIIERLKAYLGDCPISIVVETKCAASARDWFGNPNPFMALYPNIPPSSSLPEKKLRRVIWGRAPEV